MDIGAEISKKIQMAITAKLKELDAYVDDELPDYIMIMVANKKTESQMTDALSLFLSKNTKIFTAWLHNLLTTLRKSKCDKKGVKQPRKIQTKSQTVAEPEQHGPEDPGAFKQQTPTNLEREDKPDVQESGKTQNKGNVISEAVITINPEADDILNDELFSEVTASESFAIVSPKRNTQVSPRRDTQEKRQTQQNKTTVVSPLDEQLAERQDSGKKSSQERTHTQLKRRRDGDKGDKNRKPAHKLDSTIRQLHQDYEIRDNKKRPSSNKEDKSVTRRLQKAKKSTPARSRQDPVDSKHNYACTRSRIEKGEIREWDKEKFESNNKKTPREHKQKETSEWQDDDWGQLSDEETSNTKSKASISSTVNQVFQESEFVSEDESDDEHKNSRVNSKVAYPKRKTRVPLDKQANKTLLMKAVSEAEKSVRRKRTMVLDSRDNAPKHKKDLRSSDSEGEWVEKPTRMKRRLTGTKDSRKNLIFQRDMDQAVEANAGHKRRHEKLIVVRKTNVGTNQVRNRGKEENIVQAKPKVILLEGEEPVTVIRVQRKSKVGKVENVVYVQGSSSDEEANQVMMRDKRNFISRDPVLKEDEGYSCSAVKFDSRQAKRLSENPAENKSTIIKTKHRATAKVPLRPQYPILQTAPKSEPKEINPKPECQGPRFIVTLDGVVSTKHKTMAVKGGETNGKSKQFIFQPITAPPVTKILTSPPTTTTWNLTPTPPAQKPLVIEAIDTEEDQEEVSNNLADEELRKMRKKLIEMQEEATKLKKMQAKLAAAQTGQNSLMKSNGGKRADNTEAEQRSIYIGNVHFSISEKQLSEYFSICGKVARATILKDAFTGHPKGFAYLEFNDKRAVSSALALDNTHLNNRVIRVTLKQSKPAGPRYPTSRAFYHTRPTRRLYRGSRYGRTRIGISAGVKLPSRNKTWVNPSIADVSK